MTPSTQLHKGLTPKASLFLEHYFANGMHAGKAADQAGFANAQTALASPGVREAIDLHKALAAERVGLTADFLLATLKSFIDFDFGDLYGEDGEEVDVRQLPAHVRRAIASLEHGQWGRKVKAHDKLGAITLAMKHLGLLTERVELSGDIGVTTLADRMRARALARNPDNDMEEFA